MGSNNNMQGLLPIGATLQMGKYHVDGYLSSGGFGNTYIITNVQFDERYAMKEFFMKGINERLSDTTTVRVSNPANREQFVSQREKFKKEARRLRKLHNGHIVQVYDMFEENDTSYYVMDLIDGESLSNRLKRTRRPFSEAEVRKILSQVLDGLAEVHSQGIYHLDLKPANIMLDKTGKATLIDFGACKQLGSNEGQTSTSSSFCYSAGYAPTEQIDQKMERIGAWTDLYALGATLYNLLTNHPPLSSTEIQDGEHPAYPVSVSDEMQSLISWMMQPNRKYRPQTVKDVRERIANKPYPLSDNDEETIIADSQQRKEFSPQSDDEETVFTKNETPSNDWYKNATVKTWMQQFPQRENTKSDLSQEKEDLKNALKTASDKNEKEVHTEEQIKKSYEEEKNGFVFVNEDKPSYSFSQSKEVGLHTIKGGYFALFSLIYLGAIFALSQLVKKRSDEGIYLMLYDLAPLLLGFSLLFVYGYIRFRQHLVQKFNYNPHVNAEEGTGRDLVLYTINGIGMKFAGDFRHLTIKNHDTYVTYYCLCVLYVPILFFHCYRVAAQDGTYKILGREDFSFTEVCCMIANLISWIILITCIAVIVFLVFNLI